MIYVTGDIHGDIDIHKLNTKRFPEQKKMTKEDYLIICGDFGCIWYPKSSPKYKSDLHWLKWLEKKSFTTLFVDGNHENFEELYTYPIIEKFGGKVRQISDSVFHLMRGEIYEIEGKKFFCFGGASSHDKHTRKEGVSWWSQELPTVSEMNYGIDNLYDSDKKVDYIISHCCSSKIQDKIRNYYGTDGLTQFFNIVESEIDFSHWYFGHYHEDLKIDEKHTCLYDVIEKIK